MTNERQAYDELPLMSMSRVLNKEYIYVLDVELHVIGTEVKLTHHII